MAFKLKKIVRNVDTYDICKIFTNLEQIIINLNKFLWTP